MENNRGDLVQLTAEIVSAFITNNAIRSDALPDLISSTYAALTGMSAPPQVGSLTPAVPIKKSITPDHLISLEDGKRYKSLKRHLAGRGMTPAQYREKWGLSGDYPMVAANYAKQRSELAKSLGLGRKVAERRAEKTKEAAPPKSRGRKPKAKTVAEAAL